MDGLGAKLKRVLKDAGLSPRILGAVTKVHYTTIYGLIRGTYTEETSTPATVQLLTTALHKIEKLLAERYLPFKQEIRHKERASLLSELFDKVDLSATSLQA